MSKSRTSPANRVGKVDASNRVTGPMPDRPARMLVQACGMSLPTGLTIPRPVTTTLRRVMSSAAPEGSSLRVGLDVVDGLLDAGDLLGFLVRDLGLEFLLERQHEFHGVVRVRTQVVDEHGFVLDFRFVYAELLGDDFLDSLLDVFHFSLAPDLGAPALRIRGRGRIVSVSTGPDAARVGRSKTGL